MQKEIIGYVVTDENDNPITLEGVDAVLVWPDPKRAKFWKGPHHIRTVTLKMFFDLRDRSDSKPGFRSQR